jgi:hypothetical protein
MKKIFPLPAFLLLILLGTACHDKDKQPEPIINTDPKLEIGGAMVYSIYHTIYTDTTLNKSNVLAGAFFGEDTSTKYIKVNSVSLDGIDLPYDSLESDYTYYDIPGTHNPSSLHWNVNGNNGIPNVDYTNTKGLPVCNWNAFAPNEIDVKKDLNLMFTDLKNTDYIYVTLSDMYGHMLTRDLDNMSTPVVIYPASELATLELKNATDFFFIQFTLANTTFHTAGGKLFNFANQQSYSKVILPH